MSFNFKPGGGNKMQPYVPKGHGDKSGEYTDKEAEGWVLNVKKKYNYKKSILVKRVDSVFAYHGHS